MILVIEVAARSLALALSKPDGALTSLRDATWWVGSGQSMATHLQQLLVDASIAIDQLERIVVIDRGGSFTSARTAFAFANGLAWAVRIPLCRYAAGSDEPLAAAVRSAVQLPTQLGPITPSYLE